MSIARTQSATPTQPRYTHHTPCFTEIAYLDRTRVDDPLLIRQSLSDSILCYHGLTGRGMCGYEHALVSLDGVDGDLLEGIEGEFVFASGFGGWDVL